MRSVTDLYDAKASHIWDTMTCHANVAGYRVPNYQRTYDWSADNIRRLLDDCLNGFYYLSQGKKEDSFTFLGTLILVREKDKESTFDGTSLSIVDGQQRLTTLTLFLCSLIQELTDLSSCIDEVSEKHQEWLKQEFEFQIECLHACVIGEQSGRGRNFPYPRIVRDGDARGRGEKESEYKSTIGKFLMAFSDYYVNQLKQFSFPTVSETAENQRFKKNYELIRTTVKSLSDIEAYEDWESDMLLCSDFGKRGVRALFEKLSVYKSDSERDKAIAFAGDEGKVEALVRTLLFSSYMTRCVVLTRVETDDVDSAFDIFDSLNTTGEPLTAIETLKPRVILFEDGKAGYAGSRSESGFIKIDKHLNEVFKESDQRQRETKELLVMFALYLEGSKLSKELSPQRSWIRSQYEKISDSDSEARRQYIVSLGDLAEFRRFYWDRNGIKSHLPKVHGTSQLGQIQLCTALIRDMNTSLALPLIARYWSKFRLDKDSDRFLDALKAITAFIVIRRAATGQTKGIDSVFRDFMEKSQLEGEDPLCTGFKHTHELIDVQNLRKAFKNSLADHRLGITDRSAWVSMVSEVPLAQTSKPLSRFLHLAAAHRAEASSKEPGLWTRENVRPSDSNNYLTFDKWNDPKYKTLEHIAPDSNPQEGWDAAIYTSTYTRHTLGNLSLLPQQENSAIGNKSWKKKKHFYLAMTERSTAEQEKLITEASKEGFQFTKKTTDLLKKGERLALLDPIRDVDDWTAGFIKKRTANIAGLAWDSMEGWLF
jgi:uncharacterized protein with ParB-like and HNH nuclease domain